MATRINSVDLSTDTELTPRHETLTLFYIIYIKLYEIEYSL